jgi:hypothetical protein
MTPFNHLIDDTYLNAYRLEIGADIASSRMELGPLHSLRRRIAQGLVRAGARLLPEKSDVLGATVSLLAVPQSSSIERKAA